VRRPLPRLPRAAGAWSRPLVAGRGAGAVEAGGIQDVRWLPNGGSLPARQGHPGQDQGDAGEGGHGDVLVEHQDSEHDRDHRQQVGHRGRDGRSLAGNDLVVQHVSEPRPDDAEHRERRDALGRHVRGPHARDGKRDREQQGRGGELARRQDDGADTAPGQEPVHVDVADRIAHRCRQALKAPRGEQLSGRLPWREDQRGPGEPDDQPGRLPPGGALLVADGQGQDHRPQRRGRVDDPGRRGGYALLGHRVQQVGHRVGEQGRDHDRRPQPR
jgi:hypothetical protein